MHFKQKVIILASVEITIKITAGLHYHDSMCILSMESMLNICWRHILLEVDFWQLQLANQDSVNLR